MENNPYTSSSFTTNSSNRNFDQDSFSSLKPENSFLLKEDRKNKKIRTIMLIKQVKLKARKATKTKQFEAFSLKHSRKERTQAIFQIHYRKIKKLII